MINKFFKRFKLIEIYLNLLKTKENKIFNGVSENFYLQLLENQYLSRNINLK